MVHYIAHKHIYMKNIEALKRYKRGCVGIRRLTNRTYFNLCIRIGRRAWWYSEKYYF